MSYVELSKCPCCDSCRVEILRDSNIFFGQVYSEKYPEAVANQDHGFKIRCDDCGLQSCWWHYESEAIEAWQYRKPEPDYKDICLAMVGAVSKIHSRTIKTSAIAIEDAEKHGGEFTKLGKVKYKMALHSNGREHGVERCLSELKALMPEVGE